MVKANQDGSHSVMDVTEYRREFAAYNAEIELAHFNQRAGFTNELNLKPIIERFSDLFTKDSIETIKNKKQNTPANQETEIKSLDSLLTSSQIGFIERCAREVTDEVARCEVSSKVSWNKETISIHSATRVLANEDNAQRRQDLYSRWADAVGSCNDLRSARFEELQSASHELGFENLLAFYRSEKKIDYKTLANQTNNFLARTEENYFNSLNKTILLNMTEVAPSELHHADYFRFNRMVWLDVFFPKHNLKKAYAQTMEGLGIDPEKQTNIKIDDEIRPQKNARAACFRIKPPDDVRLLLSPIGGIYDYRTFFHEAGHAQHFAWMSHSLFERNPEFIYTPENATTEAFAFLFQNLFNDPIWVSENLPHLREEQAKQISKETSLLTLFSVRRACAKLTYEIELHSSTDMRSEKLAQNHAASQSQATGFKRGHELYLWDVDDGFYCADYLRAWAFEAGFREHLKSRYGRHWWKNKKSADELIDLWNTGSRYRVEELAQLVGFGETGFDFLADDLIKAIREK